MKIKHLTTTVAFVFFLSAAYCQDSTLHHLKNRDSMGMHRSDTSWKNNSMRKSRTYPNRMDSTNMGNDRMDRPLRKTRNTSPNTDSLKQ